MPGAWKNLAALERGRGLLFVIPSEVEGSRCEGFKVTPRDPSTVARDDREKWRLDRDQIGEDFVNMTYRHRIVPGFFDYSEFAIRNFLRHFARRPKRETAVGIAVP